MAHPDDRAFDWKRALLEAYAVNEQMNQYLLKHLDPRAWRAKPPGSRGRTIAAIFAHMHNMRLKWLRTSKYRRVPAPLDPRRVTPQQARAALGRSAACVSRLVTEALARPGVPIASPPWERPHPDPVSFSSYLASHDAHHRGQVTVLARQMGYGLGLKGYGLWHWAKLRRAFGLGR